MPSKIVLLGICAANRDLLIKWADEGLLPNYKSAMQHGLTGFIDSMPGFYVGATWPSFATCVSPAKHSRHYISQLVPGSYRQVRKPKGEGILRDPFWLDLSRAGCKVAILDVPHTKAHEDINGIQVVEWGAHDGDYARTITYPPELGAEIEDRFGPNPAPRSCDGKKTPEEFADFRDRLVASAAARADLTKHFLAQSDWALFAQVWTESHCAGHQCWHLHDKSHPLYDAEVAEFVGNPIKDVYVAIDKAIGEVLETVDDKTIILLYTGHGMGPKFDAQFFLDDILLKLGYANPPKKEVLDEISATSNRHRRVDDFLTLGWQCMPEALKRLAQPMRQSLRGWVEESRPTRAPAIDPASSRCFTVKNNSAHGGIRINLAGREPEGKVQRGPEYDALIERLVSDLMEIVNLDSSEPIVDRVFRTDSVYHGQYLDHLPDVLIEWNQSHPVFAIGSDKIGKLQGVDPYLRTGDHRKGGMFIALGPGLQPRRLDRPVDVRDFGPTIARLLDVDLVDVEGTPIAVIANLPVRENVPV